ncbi:LPXTG cell wall anchor domain-containing protein [Brevibacterium sp. GP-SGM9]|uniref:LPXTG cell wall anchor domain-containing protein n=1 Tax=unclassified Brevibacterium TaxID=2614124 RepID=UPI001E42D4A0|nr:MULTISPECIES: LPXTG cell wall anchor domain-containing protein [unclassified Brevibacterium]MCD1284546.1 hemagglutinin [Brevibacterium sp. CCUG 69071]MDK8435836.1 LPXTG cell wall anchor domain-containing protein [Brevibacterium sp. H-BE7]
MQKKLVQSSLALSAAAALGLGGALTASPAMADNGPQKLDVQSETQVQKALADVDGINAYGAKGGKLNLGVEKKTSEIKDLEKKYKNINVTEGVKELKRYAENDVVGGAGYLAEVDGGSGACSTGFSGWDGDGNPVILTAGHCSKIIEESGEITGDSTVSETEEPKSAPANGGEGFKKSGNGVLGDWGYHSYGSGDLLDGSEDPSTAKASDIDFAVINVDKSKYNVKNGVTDWSSADSNDLSSKLATDITKVGAHKDGKIQKSGRTTGLTEGDVFTEYNDQFDYANVGGYWVHGFGVTSPESKPFSQPGDSGGAVFQGDTAVGVISGGGPLDDGSDRQFGWVADLDHSLEESGVDFSLKDPADETPEAPDAPEAKDQTIEPKGDVKGKAAAGAEVKVEWHAAKGAQAAKDGSETVKADKDGNFTLEGPEAEGDYDYSATAVVDGQESDSTDFTVTVKEDETETPAPVEREINVDPKEIAASDFVKEDKGVTVSVKGFEEGEKVTLKVASGPENVKGITLDETANEEGVAAFSIYGTSDSDPSVYLGKYDVQVTGANDTDDEKALAGSFNVVEDEDGNGGGNGGDDDGNGDGGSDLPRTGAELTGLAAGAGLLVVGGTAVFLTLRRNKKN